jgi:hypothetical protein
MFFVPKIIGIEITEKGNDGIEIYAVRISTKKRLSLNVQL